MAKSFGTVWSFKTDKLEVVLILERDYNYRYDGDDENGETQSALDSGEYVAFDSRVEVLMGGERIGFDLLCGCVYSAEDMVDFYTAHRSTDPVNRNCSIMRAKNGEKSTICHYFPDMVREAVREARDYLRDLKDSLPIIRD